MNSRSLATALLVAAMTLPAVASASAFDSIKDSASSMMGSSSSDQSQALQGGQLLQQLGSGSFNLGSIQNVAGVLGYCQKQGYAPSATDMVKDKLTSKLGGTDKAEQSEDYKSGLAGLLKDGQGNSFDLSNLKDSLGKRICSSIADQATSKFLGQ